MTTTLHHVSVLVAWALVHASAAAQPPSPAKIAGHGALAGVVRDLNGRPVANAEVVVDGLTLKAASDDSGRFHLAGVPAGRNGFVVRRIGYASVSFETSLAADSTLVLQVTLRTLQSLDPVLIDGERTVPGLARVGFYERQQKGLGTFIKPDAIDSLAFVGTPSQLLRSVNGIEVQCRGSQCSVRSRTPPYCLQLFVDGRYTAGTTPFTALDEVLTTGAIGAIEIYRHPSEVPIEFQGPLVRKVGGGVTGQAGCGAIVVWTRVKVR